MPPCAGLAVDRQRPPPGLIHHSDRGIQNAAEADRSALARSDITPSMSGKGDCWDNAPIGSFIHTLKTERARHRVYATRNRLSFIPELAELELLIAIRARIFENFVLCDQPAFTRFLPDNF